MGPKWYVKYVVGSGCMLQSPLTKESGSQFSFEAGLVYEIGSYSDMLRLTEYGAFVEVDQSGNPKQATVATSKVADAVVAEPAAKNPPVIAGDN